MPNGPITRSILLDNIKAARKALDNWEPDVDDYADAYSEMLDECYSFASVGGPFAHMSPSQVLKECDETAWRCGLNDYVDGIDPEDNIDRQELVEALENAEAELEAFDAKEGA